MRLDNYIVQIGLFETRTKAQQAISRGEIFVDKKVVTKYSHQINEKNPSNIEYIYTEKYVSLGGYKLKKAINVFNFKVENLVVADIGASTGGFTDCLLKNGAKKVYSIDLNDDLLHVSLKNNDRVVRVIKNAKDLKTEDFSEIIDLIVADLSFISLKDVISVFSNLLYTGKKLIVLIKPQFETGQKIKFKNGIVKDKKIQVQVCKNIFNIAIDNSLCPLSFTTAPIVDGKNLEFLMLFEKDGKVGMNINEIK